MKKLIIRLFCLLLGHEIRKSKNQYGTFFKCLRCGLKY